MALSHRQLTSPRQSNEMNKAKEKRMDAETIGNIITIVENLPTDGRYLKYSDVSALLTRSQWDVCYEWLCLNAKRYVSLGSQRITVLSAQKKEILMEKLRMLLNDAEQKSNDRELNNQVLEDSLCNNKVTRRIAICSLAISLATLIISVVPRCSHSVSSFGEQHCFKNDSTFFISRSVQSESGNTYIAPNLAKSLTVISDSSRNTRFMCDTLISSMSIVAVLSSTGASLNV